MGMLSRLRGRGEALVARHLHGRAVSFAGRIPGLGTRIEFTLQVAAEPEADGERLRLRAHSRVSMPGREVRSWLDVRGSTAALDDGCGALVPERLGSLGIAPDASKPVQSWAGAVEGPHPGFAMLTLLQLDKARLPAALRRALGGQPFHLTATAASVVERH